MGFFFLSPSPPPQVSSLCNNRTILSASQGFFWFFFFLFVSTCASAGRAVSGKVTEYALGRPGCSCLLMPEAPAWCVAALRCSSEMSGAFSACLIRAYHQGRYGEDWETLRAKVTWIIPALKIESPAKRSEVFLLSHLGEACAAPVSRQCLASPWLQSPCRYRARGCLRVSNLLGSQALVCLA